MMKRPKQKDYIDDLKNTVYYKALEKYCDELENDVVGYLKHNQPESSHIQRKHLFNLRKLLNTPQGNKE